MPDLRRGRLLSKSKLFCGKRATSGGEQLFWRNVRSHLHRSKQRHRAKPTVKSEKVSEVLPKERLRQINSEGPVLSRMYENCLMTR